MAPGDSVTRGEGSKTEKTKRRVNKPLIEKRRRERINDCLNQLQSMITQLDSEKSKIGRPTKLEKADILEMTVDFVKRSKSQLQETPPTDNSQYSAGYERCMEEINAFFKSNTTTSSDLQSSILKHVSKQCSSKHINLESSPMKNEEIKPEESQLKTLNSRVLVNIQPKPSISECKEANDSCPPKTSQVLPETPKSIAGPLTPPVALVYNGELPTYVLVPTATLCQSIALPFGHQPSTQLPLGTQSYSQIQLGAQPLVTKSLPKVVANDNITGFDTSKPYEENSSGTNSTMTDFLTYPNQQLIQLQHSQISSNFSAVSPFRNNDSTTENAYLTLPNVPLNLSSQTSKYQLNYPGIIGTSQHQSSMNSDQDMWRPW